ncbi:MAG: hypothetical protein Q9161_005115 [Pseudevernia consocians]
MIRQAPRCLFRAPIPSFRSTPTRRFLSTAPPAQKSRSWKNYATRLGLAVGVIYYYNSSTLFAEEPPFALPPPNSPSDEIPLPTLESVKSNRQEQTLLPTPPPESTEPETLEEREQQASQEGAFNEETGEINWDCPCLGGMAHGPCGEQFRGAFSCFVFSKADPKGMDCIDNFKTMQSCFREHPDIYGSELEEDDDDDAPAEEGAPAPSPAAPPDSGDGSIPAAATSATPESQAQPVSSPNPSASDAGTSDTERAQAAKQQVERDHGEPASESDEMVPKAAHDATGANAEK